MVRYNRVPTRNESSRDIDSSEDVGEGRVPSEENSRRNRKILKRRGSHSRSPSSGSYTSIERNEEDYLNLNLNNQQDDNGGLSHISAELSPLNNTTMSYVSDDDLAGADGLPSSRGSTPSRSTSPKPIYPSITAVYSNSFDLDDDDDDDVEANLKRYHLDFSSTDARGASLTHNNDDGNQFANTVEASNRCSRAAKYLWFSFQSVRQQARQRRAQLLLQQTERNWRQSLWICILTSCDATDSGILLVAAIMVVWILAIIFAKNPIVRRRGLVVGIVLFVIRVGTRPLYQFFLRQRQKRQLRQLEEIPWNPPDKKTRSNDVSTDQQHHHLTYSDGTLELHAIRGGNNKYNANRIRTATSDGCSDPTIAAI